MNNEEFTRIRHHLGKSQSQIAQLLCVSPKAVQSFEQGWRRIPVYIERQLLVLLSMKRSTQENLKPCWEIKHCANSCRQVEAAEHVTWERTGKDKNSIQNRKEK